MYPCLLYTWYWFLLVLDSSLKLLDRGGDSPGLLLVEEGLLGPLEEGEERGGSLGPRVFQGFLDSFCKASKVLLKYTTYCLVSLVRVLALRAS